MNKKQRYFAFIPARGGSKRILNKNMQTIAGKPLIQYTIDAALNSLLFEKVIVSTDNSEIETFSVGQGVEAIKRPVELAQDSSSTIDAVIHFIKEYRLKDDDIIVLLQPTSPLRDEKHIIEAIETFQSNKRGSLASVTRQEHSVYWSFKIENNSLKPVMGEEYLKMRSQDLPEIYIPNGAIFIAAVKTILEEHTFYCEDTLPYIMKIEDSIDIDEPLDLKMAETLIEMKTLEEK